MSKIIKAKRKQDNKTYALKIVKQFDIKRFGLHENKFSYNFAHIISLKGKFEKD